MTLTLLVYTLAWLWPLPKSLGSAVVKGHHFWDQLLNSYLLAEARHALMLAPTADHRLMDASILHPHADVLAYSENLFSLSLLSAPLAGLKPVLVHNVLQIAAFVLTGVATYRYTRRRVESPWAAAIATFVFTFAPFRLGLMSKLQLVFMPLIPWLLGALEDAVAKPTRRNWVLAALLAVAQIGVCIYHVVQWLLLLAPVLVVAVIRNRRRLATRQAIVAIGLAAAIAGPLATMLLLPYSTARSAVGLVRPRELLVKTSGSWEALETTSPFTRFFEGRAWVLNQSDSREPMAFPGATLLTLGGFGLLLGPFAWRRTRGRPLEDTLPRTLFGFWTHAFWLATAGVLFFGLGPDAPGGEHGLYAWLLDHVPGFDGLRYPNRFVIPAGLCLAVFAGIGVDALLRWAGRPAALWIGPMLALVAPAELWTRELPLEPTEFRMPPPALVSALRSGEAFIELPYEVVDRVGTYQDHLALEVGRPTANGYTGFDPPIWKVLRDILTHFPDDIGRKAANALGIDRVLLRRAPKRLPAWLELLARDGSTVVARVVGVRPGAATALRARVRSFHAESPPSLKWIPDVTLHGPLNAGAFPLILDDDPTTVWSTRHPQQKNELWFKIRLKEATTVTALWLDTRREPADLPLGVRISGRLGNGPWRVLREETPHLPLVRLAAAPATTWDVIRFPATPVTELLLETTIAAKTRWGTLAELRVEGE